MRLETVGVAGLGLLGRGIATCLLASGFRVIGYTKPETREAARKHVTSAIDDLVQHGAAPASLRDEWPKRFVEAQSAAELAPCDFVIESIFEDLNAKVALFDELERIVRPDVPIASNTSALPITALQRGRAHPERFIGTHWAEPCHVTRFLEVIRGEQTNDATADAAMELARRAGKEPCLVRKDVDGFIVNRLGYAMYREAFWLLENGVADVETIDRSFRNALCVFANIAGPFRWMDLTGIAPYAAVMKRLFPQLSKSDEVPAFMRELVDSGAQGIKNDRGFYKYGPGEAERWERVLTENVWRVREVTDELLGRSDK